ncbi:MAG: hypothetical protein KDG58_07670, partial [Anaerolineae bacterium]|nr:hypothetical protein [Anaerolineae bacterium]
DGATVRNTVEDPRYGGNYAAITVPILPLLFAWAKQPEFSSFMANTTGRQDFTVLKAQLFR